MLSKRGYALMAVLLIASGIIGGLVTRWAFTPSGVEAQSSPVSPDVTTRRLRVVDGQDRVRLVMGTLEDPNSSPALVLADTAGRARLALSVAEDDERPFVALFDRDLKLRGNMTTFSDGRGVFNLFNADGTLQVSMRQIPEGGAGIGVYDANGQVRVAVGVTPDGTPGLTFFDPEGRPIAPAAMPSEPPAMPSSEDASRFLGDATRAEFGVTKLWDLFQALDARAP